MMTTHLLPVTKIELDELKAAKRLSALIYFLRGEISFNELKVKVGKTLPSKLVDLCGSFVNGYLPKLTQENLGKMLGCTYAAVQTWEKGKRPSFPRLPTFIKIAIFCNLTVNELTEMLFDYTDEVNNNFETLNITCDSNKPVKVNPDAFENLLDELTKQEQPEQTTQVVPLH